MRVTLHNGNIVPAECGYLGYRDGTHMWGIVSPPVTAFDLAGIEVGYLPPNTSLGAKMVDDTEIRRKYNDVLRQADRYMRKARFAFIFSVVASGLLVLAIVLALL